MVYVLHGNDSFSLHRRLGLIKKEMENNGYEVSDISVAQSGEKCISVAQGNVFFSSKRCLIVLEPEKDIEVCLRLLKLADDDLSLLFYSQKKFRKTSKLLKAVSKENVQVCEKPDKAYKMDGFAQEFVISESKALGTPLENRAFAKAIVQRCGVDLGTLRWEVYKASVLARSHNRTQITIADIKGTICPIEQIGPYGMLAALEAKNEKLFLRAAKRCYSTSGRDPTMGAIALLYPAIMNWLGIYELSQKGRSPNEIASSLKMNPWLVGKMLPVANRWGNSSRKLLRTLSKTEKAVKSGAAFSWGVLVLGLTKEISK